jgi:ornithine cyclodeaminase/alanine dehydrogenase-like protein (mu-crystallin family)
MIRFLLLTEQHVRSVLPMSDLIASMESALARFSAGDVQQPVRTVLQVGTQNAFVGLMPAYDPHPPAMGAKIVTVFGGNADRGLPTHLATIMLLDPETGALQALMDGRYITEARTAAVSAVSVRHLARPQAGVPTARGVRGGVEASTLAILGTGVQARSHLEAYAEIRTLREVRVWSPRVSSRKRFVEETAHAPVLATESAEEAVRGADLIVLATSSPTPVIEDAWVAPGTHVVSVGACRPDQRELAPGLTARGRLFVDSRAGALAESGDVVLGIAERRFAPDHIAGELGELILGRVRGRENDEDVTIFKSLGMAVEDVAAAELAYRRALERGVGTREVV